MKQILAVTIASIFLFSCASDKDDAPINIKGNKKLLTINLSSDSLVYVSQGSVPLNASFNGPNFAGGVGNCLTPVDVASGSSIVNDTSRCFSKIGKVDSAGGHASWRDATADEYGTIIEVSATGKCGIINPDGSVWEVPLNKCPKKDSGFINGHYLKRVSPTKLRGISSDGVYTEYDQSTDSITVVFEDLSGPINQISESSHQSIEFIYKTGTNVKKVINGISEIITELNNHQFHTIDGINDVVVQMSASGSEMRRCYFDSNGILVQGSDLMAICNSLPVPNQFSDWLNSGVGPMPRGPLIQNLSGCEKNKIGNTTILFCNGKVYKYGDINSDLIQLNLCNLGNCGNIESLSCSTNEHYFIFTAANDAKFINARFAFTKIDIVNETYSHIYEISDSVNGISQTDIDTRKITSISCSGSTVTATTATKTLIINNADTVPVLIESDIVAEGVI